MSNFIADTESIGNFLDNIDTKINTQFNKLEKLQYARENTLYNVRNLNIPSSMSQLHGGSSNGNNKSISGNYCTKLCNNIDNLPINNSILYNYKEFHHPGESTTVTFSLMHALRFD
jgi:hypothetical protein